MILNFDVFMPVLNSNIDAKLFLESGGYFKKAKKLAIEIGESDDNYL